MKLLLTFTLAMSATFMLPKGTNILGNENKGIHKIHPSSEGSKPYTVNANDRLTPKYIQPNAVNLFQLTDVHLTGGQAYGIQKQVHKYLLSLEPDRMLSWFRREAGLTPKAEPYPAWESEDLFGGGPLSGHILSFYMSGMAMMYQDTGDKAILEKLKYVTDELYAIQEAGGDGFIAATPQGRQVYGDVVSPTHFLVEGVCVSGCWEPIYVMNKFLQGLHECYLFCGLEKARTVEVKLAEWFGTHIIDSLNHDQMQKLLVAEHGGINESFVEIYELTGDKRFLNWAERLNDERMLIPLSEGKDILRGWHANTQIAKFTGFLAEGRHNGDKSMISAAALFWDIVIKNHTWVNGGNSSGEHFFAEDEYIKKIGLEGGPESCNSVNLMRLTEALYELDGDMKRIDYYERVLLNHIMANYHPETGVSCYFTSMRPGHFKVFGRPFDDFWCCIGTGLFAPAKLAKMVYAYKKDSLMVNMFLPTTLNWREKDFSLEQQTNYPDENSSRLIIRSGGELSLCIREPYWAETGSMKLHLNGKSLKGKKENGYIVVKRNWNAGDCLTIDFRPRLMIEPLKKFDQYYSIQYGAHVMGAKVDNHGLTEKDFLPKSWKDQTAHGTIPESEVPRLIGTAKQIGKAISVMPGSELKLIYNNHGSKVELIPFSRILLNRYVIYFPHRNTEQEFDADDQKDKSSGLSYIRKQQTDFCKIQVDSVVIGDETSERHHRMETINSKCGNSFGLTWRHADNGGFIMYEMKCMPDRQMRLAILFRQDDKGERMSDLLVDGQHVKTFNHCQPMNGVDTPLYYDIVDIPFKLTKGKTSVTIKFNAHNHNIAGGIFDVRMIKSTD